MSADDQAPRGVDPELVSVAADDLDRVVEALEGVKSLVEGLARLLKREAAQARQQ